jgi:hypothetical protein
MPSNYVLLNQQTVSAPVSSVVISNIPQSGYTDLKLVVSARSTANGGQNINLRFNSITSGYLDKILGGTGSSVSSFTSGNTSVGGSIVVPGADFTANFFGNGEILIPNYTGGSQKSFMSTSVTENVATLSYIQWEATKVTSTDAINAITMTLSSGNFATGSSVSVYGIAALGTTPVFGAKATGGDIITNDGTYWYHAFLSSGIFLPSSNITADVFVVAGGGAGGAASRGVNEGGGGGGAGGVLGFASQALSATNYAVTIGAGGTGASQSAGSNGSNSRFASLTACVGGGSGAGAVIGDGRAGGSGGGGSNWQWSNGGAPTSGQGFRGGNGRPAPAGGQIGNAGGGGAGAQGEDKTGTDSNGTAGGTGVNTYTNATWLASGLSATNTGVSGLIAGGGGGGGNGSGGAGGTANGGGGAGSAYNANVSGVAGTVNTGGGGGGSNGNSGGNGGSGIVIVRYTMA